MPKRLTTTLDSPELAQLLDWLCGRVEAWEKTADFMDSGYSADDAFVCEECSDADQARVLAGRYRQIADRIQAQVARQGGW